MTEHEVNVGARVHGSDGEDLGEIEQLIVHPDTGEIDGILLKPHWYATPRIVAVDLIARTNADGVTLSIDRHDAEFLPTYVVEQFVRPPAGTSSGLDGSSWMVRNTDGSTGSASLFLEPHGDAATRNISSLPDDTVLISGATEVVGSDGKKVGQIDEIFVDDEQRITGLLVRGGWLFKHDVTIPTGVIGVVTHDRIHLTVSADEAEQATWGPPES
jgi:sporulation protein YlmC with PRC-barrel domain